MSDTLDTEATVPSACREPAEIVNAWIYHSVKGQSERESLRKHGIANRPAFGGLGRPLGETTPEWGLEACVRVGIRRFTERRGNLDLWTILVVQNYGLVRCEAGPVGGELGEVNRVFQWPCWGLRAMGRQHLPCSRITTQVNQRAVALSTGLGLLRWI